MSEGQQIENVNYEKLIFDPENPRLPSKLRGYGKEKQVIEWMLLYENVIELMGSIGEKGYFLAEPLLITPSSKRKGFFEVIEGNRRLAAVKLLNNPSLATTKKNAVAEVIRDAKEAINLPAIKFNHKNEVIIYLGYKHITGVKEWDALAKAQYLDTLRQELKIKNKKEEYKTLARIIGSSTTYVKRLLSGLKVYNVIERHNFFDIHGLDEISVGFGVLYNAVGMKGISSFVGIDLDDDDPVKNINLKHLKETTSWIFEKQSDGYPKVRESRNLKDLDSVVRNNNALKAFRAGRPLEEAILLTGKPNEVFNNSLSRSIGNLKTAVDIMHNIEPDETHLNLVEELIRRATDLKTLIKGKING